MRWAAVTEVPWINAQVWLVFPPKGGQGVNLSNAGIGIAKALFLVAGRFYKNLA
jgi:hypothetical protein